MLDKEIIKKELEEEKTILEGQMSDIGKLDSSTDQWQAIPDASLANESDQNDAADRFEDFESRSSTLNILKDRFNKIILALKRINNKSFGKCEVCNEDIEIKRLKANPAATTCKKHLNN